MGPPATLVVGAVAAIPCQVTALRGAIGVPTGSR